MMTKLIVTIITRSRRKMTTDNSALARYDQAPN